MTAAGPLWALAHCSLPQDPGTRRQRRWTVMSKKRFCFFTSSSPGTAHQATPHSLSVGPTTAVPSTVAGRGSSQQPMRVRDKHSMHECWRRRPRSAPFPLHIAPYYQCKNTKWNSLGQTGKLHPHHAPSSQASGMGPAACSCWYLALRPAARLLLIAAALGVTFEITGGGAFVVTTPLRFSRHCLFLSNSPSPAFRPQPGSTQPGEQQCRSAAKHAKQRSRLEAAGPQNRTKGERRQFSRLEAAAPKNGGGKGSANPVEAVTAAAQPLRRAAVTVRRAKEADYEGVAGIRGVIVPVGMSGATGFLGGKVVIDDPAEAKKRLLMAKVADLVSGETTALIALESGRVVGTIDCAIQPSITDTTQNLQARPGATNQAQQRNLSTERSQVFLKNLFVLPEQRRRGIARKLVEGAEEFARKERAGALCLQVDRKNSAARDLYYSCGFEDMEPPGPVEGGLGGALLRALGMGKNFMVKEA